MYDDIQVIKRIMIFYKTQKSRLLINKRLLQDILRVVLALTNLND